MGLGKSLKKAWKKTFGWVDDGWMKDYVLPTVAAIGGAIVGGPMGAIAAAGVYQGGRTMHLQGKAEKQQQAIANQQAAAAAMPVATSVAEQKKSSAETADINYATERRRAMSTADTTLSSARLQRWAKNGKRKTL